MLSLLFNQFVLCEKVFFPKRIQFIIIIVLYAKFGHIIKLNDT